jgi:serine/threonine-protein kinase
MVGQQFGHYRVVERVGSGAMGVVYRATDERLDRDVAIKILGSGTLDEAARLRLRKEARALSRAAHPTVATVHELATVGDQDFLVMELVPGETVADRLAQGPLEEPEVIALGCQLASGLAAAHAAGVVHRDIKPSNLKITPDGRLKILDFGVAQLRPSSTETTRTGTNPGRAVGTIPYMSPEQLRGGQPDPRSDIFSAGAVLYEMATGMRAFPERQELRLMDAVLHRPVTPPRLLKPDLSPALETCLLRALEKDPAARYQSASQLEGALQAAKASAEQQDSTIPPRPSRRALWVAAVLIIAASAGISREWLFSRGGSDPAAAVSAPATGGRLRMAVLPPRNLTNVSGLDGWLPMVQALLSGELTGIQDLGVVDPLSLNRRLTQGAAEGVNAPLAVLKEFGVTLALEASIVRGVDGMQLHTNVVDPEPGESVFTTRVDLAGEADIQRAVHAAAQSVVTYLQLRVFKLAETHDMRPWITLRERNLLAVKAFVQANQYIFKFQLAEVDGLLRRAVELDPGFVAPRLWLTQQLFDKGRTAEAWEQYRELKALEASASPFDQAMIGFAGAMLADDYAGQARYLEIALDYSPGNNILLSNLAYARRRLGQCEQVLVALEPAIAMRWEFPLVYPLWAECAIRLERFDEARKVLEGGAANPVVDPSVYGLLAGLEAAFGTSDAAGRLEAQQVARQKELRRSGGDPTVASIYEFLADRCTRRGEHDRAALLRTMQDRATP